LRRHLYVDSCCGGGAAGTYVSYQLMIGAMATRATDPSLTRVRMSTQSMITSLLLPCSAAAGPQLTTLDHIGLDITVHTATRGALQSVGYNDLHSAKVRQNLIIRVLQDYRKCQLYHAKFVTNTTNRPTTVHRRRKNVLKNLCAIGY